MYIFCLGPGGPQVATTHHNGLKIGKIMFVIVQPTGATPVQPLDKLCTYLLIIVLVVALLHQRLNSTTFIENFSSLRNFDKCRFEANIAASIYCTLFSDFSSLWQHQVMSRLEFFQVETPADHTYAHLHIMM